jgi:hypothetical protein
VRPVYNKLHGLIVLCTRIWSIVSVVPCMLEPVFSSALPDFSLKAALSLNLPSPRMLSKNIKILVYTVSPAVCSHQTERPFFFFLPEMRLLPLSISHCICLSMTIQPLWTFGRFSVFLLYTQSVGLLGWEISPSQGRYLHEEQHKQRININRHPCLE